MKINNAFCPNCGKQNTIICSDETHGQMECERCGKIVHLYVTEEGKLKRVTVNNLKPSIVASSN